jgi:hypothetical protein
MRESLPQRHGDVIAGASGDDDDGPMTRIAHGTFTVDLSPRPPDPDTEGLSQLQLRKTWAGDVEGTGWGLMISAGDPAAGTAGYVAMEVVEGRVGDHEGSFALQQFGTMAEGRPHQVYEVVPGSGGGGLAGLSGVLELTVEDGTHHYALSYDLA